MNIIVDTKQYFVSHLRQPRGTGMWAFDFEKMNEKMNDQPVWVSGTYTIALKDAKKHAAKIGADVVIVLP